MIEELRLKRGIQSEEDEALNSLRFELAIDIFRREGNVVPLTKEGKLLPGYSLTYQVTRRDMVTFFCLLGYDPGIVTDKKVIHLKALSTENGCREYLVKERWIKSKDEVEVDYDIE